MDEPAQRVTDVTERLAAALPDFLPDWSGARFYLVSGQVPCWIPWPVVPHTHARGRLPAGALRRTREYIERELSRPITIRDLATVAGLSDCHFARAFKQSTGLSPHRYLMHRRVAKAVDMLRHTDLPLSRIALDAGFADQSHFSRSIAQATGHTPRDLRRQGAWPPTQPACAALWPGAGGTTVLAPGPRW